MNLKWQLQSFRGAGKLAQRGSGFVREPCCACSPRGPRSKSARMLKNGKGSGGKQQQRQKSLGISVLSDRFENKHKKEKKKKTTKKQGKKCLLKMKHLKVLLWG